MDCGEVEDAGGIISDHMGKKALIKSLNFEYENIRLTANRDSNFTLEHIQNIAHK